MKIDLQNPNSTGSRALGLFHTDICILIMLSGMLWIRRSTTGRKHLKKNTLRFWENLKYRTKSNICLNGCIELHVAWGWIVRPLRGRSLFGCVVSINLASLWDGIQHELKCCWLVDWNTCGMMLNCSTPVGVVASLRAYIFYKACIPWGWRAPFRKTGSQEFVFDPERVLGLYS